MEQGDEVKIQSGMYEGKTGEVVAVEWESGLATVEVESFAERRRVDVEIRNLQALAGSDEELTEKVAASIRESVWQAFEIRQQLWWARRAAEGTDPSLDLIESFRQFRASMLEAYDDKVESLLEAVRQEFEQGMSPEEWLSRRSDEIRRRWQDRGDEMKSEFFREVTSDRRLDEIEREAQQRAAESSFLDSEGARKQIVQRQTSELLDDGLELWQACKEMSES